MSLAGTTATAVLKGSQMHCRPEILVPEGILLYQIYLISQYLATIFLRRAHKNSPLSPISVDNFYVWLDFRSQGYTCG